MVQKPAKVIPRASTVADAKNYKITDDRYISYFIRFLIIKKPGMELAPKHSTSTDIPVKQKGTKDFLSL